MAQIAANIGARDQGGPQTHPRSHQMMALMIATGLFFLLIGLGLIVNSSLSVSTQAQLRDDGKTFMADVVDATSRRQSTYEARSTTGHRSPCASKGRRASLP